jgi:hypothetical protein
LPFAVGARFHFVTQDYDPAYDLPAEGDDEEQHVRADVQAVSVMSALAFLPAVVFGGILFTALGLPGWTYALLALPLVLAPRLYGFWRIDQSNLPLELGGVPLAGDERRHMIIITAVIMVAETILGVLIPHAISVARGW